MGEFCPVVYVVYGWIIEPALDIMGNVATMSNRVLTKASCIYQQGLDDTEAVPYPEHPSEVTLL